MKSFLDSVGLGKRIGTFQSKKTIFAQGDSAKTVVYIKEGGVKLSVINVTGKEAVVAILGPGDFCGEGCLTGLPFRMETATAISPATLLVIEKAAMIRLLRDENQLSDRFIIYLLTRNIRVEDDLIDQLLNSIEKRLARTLLVLARCRKQDQPQKMLPKLSQDTLAKMIGTTRSQVNVFMNKFRRLGYITYKGEIQINDSLLSVVLHE
jgi:CRP-like cAMP-binding protein